QIDLAVDHHRRAPDSRQHIMDPVRLSGFGVQTMEEAAEVGIEDQPVVYRAGRDGAADFVVVPDLPGLGDVAALGSVDRIQVSDSLAVLRILTVRHVNNVSDDYRSGDRLVARLGPDRVLRISVELPEFLAGQGLVTANPPIALRMDHLHLATDLGNRS